MFESETDVLEGGARKTRFQVDYAEVLRLWRNDHSFRAFFIELLADVPFRAYRWETPVVTTDTLHRPFEFVLLECPSLDRRPDEDAFAGHFHPAPADGIAVFPNLGRDAVLVTPCPQIATTAYAHLGVFAREAPEPQNHALWRAVGQAMEDRVGGRPVWLSTAGMGVSWLHVRLDDRPKYYGFVPYREG